MRYLSRLPLATRAGTLGSVSTATSQAPVPTAARLASLPNGDDGTVQTLRYMREIARASLISNAQEVRGTALGCVRHLRSRDWTGEVVNLGEWVRDNIRYVMDPDDIELVQTPQKTLEYGQGDCDDQSTLLAALLLSLNHPAKFCAMGYAGEPFSHVLTATKVGGGWFPLETIVEGMPMGTWPAGMPRRYYLNVHAPRADD